MGYIVCLGCYLTQLRVVSDALWIRCTVCIEYRPIYLNYLKPWTCVYLWYTSGTALRDTHTVGRYIFERLCVAYHLRHLFYDSHLRHLFCDLYLRHLMYDLMNLHMRMWYLLLSSRAGFGFDISLSRLCVYIRVSFAGLNNDILDAIYGRWHGSCLYCAWFIYRGTYWHAVMIFNVVIHLSWCVISLTIWTSYWINGINLLACPHGQGSSQKRGLTF